MTTITELRKGSTKKTPMKEVMQLAPKQRIATLLKDNQKEISAALPRHVSAERMLQVSQTAVTMTPKLLECYTPSLFGALIKCTQMGLEPNNALKEAFLIPFWNGDKKRYDCNLVVGYPGHLRMIRNSGLVKQVTPRAVHEADEFSYEYGLNEHLVHKPAMANRGELQYVYLVATFNDDSKEFWVWSRNDMEEHAKRHVTAKTREKGPWKTDFEAMCLKTAINLAQKYLPKSIEMAEAHALDTLASEGKPQGLDQVLTGEFDVVPTDDDPERTDDPITDVNGEIFDGSIHVASTDTGLPVFNKDGSFRKRRTSAPALSAPQEKQSSKAIPSDKERPDESGSFETDADDDSFNIE